MWIILIYLLPLFISLPLVLRYEVEFLEGNMLKLLLISACVFLPFLLSYWFLVIQTREAYFGIWITSMYLLYHFYWIFILTAFQRTSTGAIAYSVINGLLLISLQANRRGGWMGWDFLIGLGVFLYAFISHIVAFIFFWAAVRKWEQEG